MQQRARIIRGKMAGKPVMKAYRQQGGCCSLISNLCFPPVLSWLAQEDGLDSRLSTSAAG
jgi:hypothetical protein